jgi:hypothetical protein
LNTRLSFRSAEFPLVAQFSVGDNRQSVGDTGVQLAGWKRMSKVGAAYLSLQVDNSADDGAEDGKENASAET